MWLTLVSYFIYHHNCVYHIFFNLVRCIRGKASHFAKELYKSMKGLGTDDDRLCRVIVSRCEVDMVQIKEEFQKQYKQTLAMFIAVSISCPSTTYR